MKRYVEIEKQVYQEIEKNCFGNKKRNGYRHLFGVSQLCLLYSTRFQLDQELCAIMGLLHDYSVYKNNTSFNHAVLSSELAEKLLKETILFDEKEIEIIVEAIKNHSTKNKRHDIDVVIDRIIKKEGYRSRLVDSLEVALKLTGGEAVVQNLTTKTEELFSEHLAYYFGDSCLYCDSLYSRLY